MSFSYELFETMKQEAAEADRENRKLKRALNQAQALLTEARDVLEMLDHTPECLQTDGRECICGRDEIIEKIQNVEGT